MPKRTDHVKVLRQVVLRFTRYGRFEQHLHTASPDLLPIAIPYADYEHGGWGQILLKHEPGDLTVSGLPVYQ